MIYENEVQSNSSPFSTKILDYGTSYYIERIARLEAALARKPWVLEIDLIGAGEIPADLALLIRSVLLKRSPRTRLITRARSSLQGGSVLVWLQGDERVIREDARVFFRRAELPKEKDLALDTDWRERKSEYDDSSAEADPDEGDYMRILELINEFIPVKELAGRLIGVPVLRQFGLIENGKLDRFLASVFSKTSARAEVALKAPKGKRRRRNTKSLPQGQVKNV